MQTLENVTKININIGRIKISGLKSQIKGMRKNKLCAKLKQKQRIRKSKERFLLPTQTRKNSNEINFKAEKYVLLCNLLVLQKY